MSDTLSILNTVFGYPAFRDGQRDVIDHVTAGGDALVLMPTASGKSLCYQIPALARGGVGIVVSPLIALMHDQVAALRSVSVGLNRTGVPRQGAMLLTRISHMTRSPDASCN